MVALIGLHIQDYIVLFLNFIVGNIKLQMQLLDVFCLKLQLKGKERTLLSHSLLKF